MPWYRVGTVAVTLNSNAVTGNGTAFIANSRVGDAFIGPDGKQYEVTNIASNTALSIAPPYGSTSTGTGAYALMPVQGYTKDLADQARAIIQQWGATLAGLGTVSTENVVPVTKGGTGGTTQSAARNGLGLGSAAVLNAGLADGNLLPWGAYGFGGYTPVIPGSPTNFNSALETGFYKDTGTTLNRPAGMNYGTVMVQSYGNAITTQLAISFNKRMYFRGNQLGWDATWTEVYTTANTTRGSGGALSAASPIVRVASVADSERRDLQEQTFQPAGAWGVANEEAYGVTVERKGVGEYQLHGSLGLALEGWRTQDPCSPDGGRTLGITECEQHADGSVTIRLFKQRWSLTDDGDMVLGKGVPIDVPLNSWIDVRLEMPAVEAPPPPEATEA